VLERRCADPDIFDSDRLALRLEECKEITGADGFLFAERQDLEIGQNLLFDSFPETSTIFPASRSVAKLRDAHCGRDDVGRCGFPQSRKKRRIWMLPDDFG
jgi:hypothetical protein